MTTGTPRICQLSATDGNMLRGMLAMFGEAFNDAPAYTGNPPDDAYLARLLERDSFIALAALEGNQVVGGLAAYELHKFEQARSEVYIYDLAVLATHRQQGLATALIKTLQQEAARRGAWVIFVQADTGEEDQAAIALYSKLGVRENVLHFDIPVGKQPK